MICPRKATATPLARSRLLCRTTYAAAGEKIGQEGFGEARSRQGAARKAKAAKSPVRKRAANKVIARVPAKKPVPAAASPKPAIPVAPKPFVPPLWRRRLPRWARVRSAPIPSLSRNRPTFRNLACPHAGPQSPFQDTIGGFQRRQVLTRSSRARRNVTVADHGIAKAPSSSTVTWICSPLSL